VSSSNHNTAARLTAKRKREIVVQARLDGHPLWKCAQLAGYSNEASAATAIREYFAGKPPEDIEQKRAIERERLEDLRAGLIVLRDELFLILKRGHVVIQHGKVVGRFTGWATDPETHQVLHDGQGKPIATYDEIEDDEPSIRVIAELRANTAELRKVSESLRRLDGLDEPKRIKIEDADGVDDEIEALVSELNSHLLQGPPAAHDG
jgi:hypothetical protein